MESLQTGLMPTIAGLKICLASASNLGTGEFLPFLLKYWAWLLTPKIPYI